MITLDMSFTITAIIAIIALISPIVTALINNAHQIRLKQLEYKEVARAASIKKKADVIEGYIQATGACLQLRNEDTVLAYGKLAQVALCYAPDDLQENMRMIEAEIHKRTNDLSTLQTFDTVALKLRHFLQEL